MRHSVEFFAIIVTAFLFMCENQFAQSSERHLLLISQNQVSFFAIGKVNKNGDSIFVPVLMKLVNDGYIYRSGHLNHNWGDEWNVNYWYTAKNMASFEKFRDDFIKLVMRRYPVAFASIVNYNRAHKNSIYSIHGQYPLPPEKQFIYKDVI